MRNEKVQERKGQQRQNISKVVVQTLDTVQSIFRKDLRLKTHHLGAFPNADAMTGMRLRTEMT